MTSRAHTLQGPINSPIPPARPLALLMAFEAVTLAAVSIAHLTGGGGGSKPFRPDAAGVAEAIICVALVAGVAALVRAGRRGVPIALGATCFAVFGFLVGLSFTIGGGDAFDITYHAIMLPILAATAIALWRSRARTAG
jgi:hypothetical protein